MSRRPPMVAHTLRCRSACGQQLRHSPHPPVQCRGPQTGCWPGPAPAIVRLLGLGIDWWPGHGASPGRVWCGRSAVRTLARTAAAGPRCPVLGTTPPPAPPYSCPAPWSPARGCDPSWPRPPGPAPAMPPPHCRPGPCRASYKSVELRQWRRSEHSEHPGLHYSGYPEKNPCTV